MNYIVLLTFEYLNRKKSRNIEYTGYTKSMMRVGTEAQARKPSSSEVKKYT